MVTKLIGLKAFRQNLSAYTKEVYNKQICLIILNKGKPVVKINSVDSGNKDELILEDFMRKIETARKQVQEGKIDTLANVRKRLGL